ncbi:MAG: hypothetical protein KGJ49_04325 [Alphaproteobacteria bacterium]|nr:hypothetical protein [Alphaproteobacteria bacterium]
MAQKSGPQLIDRLPWGALWFQVLAAGPAVALAFGQMLWTVNRLQPVFSPSWQPLTTVATNPIVIQAILTNAAIAAGAAIIAATASWLICVALVTRTWLVGFVAPPLVLSFVVHPTLRALAWGEVAQNLPMPNNMTLAIYATIALGATILPMVAVLPILSALRCIHQYRDAARNLGGRPRTFERKILFPFVALSLLVGTAIGFSMAMFDPFVIRVVSQGLFPSVGSVVADFLAINDWGRVSALCTFVFLLTTGAFVIAVLVISLREVRR